MFPLLFFIDMIYFNVSNIKQFGEFVQKLKKYNSKILDLCKYYEYAIAKFENNC